MISPFAIERNGQAIGKKITTKWEEETNLIQEDTSPFVRRNQIRVWGA